MAILKILSDDEQLLKTLCFLRARHKIIVLAHGCFDWLHYGHLLHLEKAKLLGDILMVSITMDEFVAKGPGRPIFNLMQRAKMVAALECVDYVVFSNASIALSVINLIQPHIYVKGDDYDKVDNGNLQDEIQAVKNHNGRFIFIRTPIYHTSELLRRYGEHYGKH